MAMNHAVSELVTCLKNGQLARKERVIISSSKIKIAILEILKREGYIKEFEVFDNGSFEEIEIHLGYNGISPVIKEIKVLSKPGKRWYSGVEDVPVVHNGLGTVILSTPKGVLSDVEAKTLNVGGELLLKIF